MSENFDSRMVYFAERRDDGMAERRNDGTTGIVKMRSNSYRYSLCTISVFIG